jgi:MOSC domain-containing protein YiiM
MHMPGVSTPMQLVHINRGTVRPLRVGERKLMSAIGKTPVTGPVSVGPLGLAGDEQADLSVHGGLSKAIYAFPLAHLAYWQQQRVVHGVSLFEEVLPPGFVGENLSLSGVHEEDVFVGDTLHFADCVLRVTQPREPCGKFNAVMGYPQAARDMLLSGHCGFYLAVERAGTLCAGEAFTLVPGSRSMSIAQALSHKRHKHLR